MSSDKPAWFNLIRAWLAKGRYGLTLPFLVGATAYHSGQKEVGRSDIELLLDDMIGNPVGGYVAHVRWCSDYQAAVFAVYESDSPLSLYNRGVEFKVDGALAPSMVIEHDVASEWKVPHHQSALREELINRTEELVVKGNFSRYWTEDGVMFGPMRKEDFEFIRNVLG